MKPLVLMVETVSGTMPYILPMGAVDLMNRLNVSKLGLNEYEVTPEYVMEAKIIVMPVHWYYSIVPVLTRALEYKRLNPEIVVITGGYTATLFERELMASGVVDFIVRGDAEPVFEQLVDAVLKGESCNSISNVTFRNGRTENVRFTTEEEYEKSNFRDISWFPTFEKVALNAQKIDEVTYLYPWISVIKGCRYECPNCMATPFIQKKWFRRSMVCRPFEAVRADLKYYSDRNDIRHCHFNTDFIDLLGRKKAKELLSGAYYDLDCYYECYRYPDKDVLDILCGSFRKVNLGIFLNPHGECVNENRGRFSDFEKQIFSFFGCLKDYSNLKVLLYADPDFASKDLSYARLALDLSGFPGVRLNRITGGLFPDLTNLTDERIGELYRYFYDQSQSELDRLRQLHRVLIPFLKCYPFMISLFFKIGSFKFRRELKKLLRGSVNG